MRTYIFKKTLNREYWENKLSSIGLSYTNDDIKIFQGVLSEKSINDRIRELVQHTKDRNLSIPFLPKLDGNCLFNSLCSYNNIFDSQDQMRIFISSIMVIFANCNIIPNNSLTLKEIFEFTNEVEYVYCINANKLYKYTYFTMCADLANDNSWDRLPVQLILLIVSLFYNVIIRIHHDNGHISVINGDEENSLNIENKRYVDIGLIFEFHYVPLAQGTHTLNICYENKLKTFFVWCVYQSNKIGLYVDSTIECGESNNSFDFGDLDSKMINEIYDNFQYIYDKTCVDLTEEKLINLNEQIQ